MNSKISVTNIMTFKGSGRTFCSYPIGVGVALSDGSHYEALIKPDSSWTSWCVQEESDHGISREYLQAHGEDIATVCLELNAFCKGKHLCNDDYIWTGHWINKLFAITGIRPSFTCFPIEYVVDKETLRDWELRKLCSNQEQQANTEICFNDKLNRPVGNKSIKKPFNNSALQEAFLISNILHKLDMTTINAHRSI